MEYSIFHNLRNKFRIPYIIRFILAVISLLIGILWIILPVIPWLVFFVLWILFLIPWEKIRHLIKIRKWIIYMIKNRFERRIIRYKVLDIIKHSKDIYYPRNTKRLGFIESIKKKFNP